MSIKHVAQVHLEQLEKVLRGDQFGMPFDAIQSLDVVMRHLPSMRYMYISCFVHVHMYMWDACVGPMLRLLELATCIYRVNEMLYSLEVQIPGMVF